MSRLIRNALLWVAMTMIVPMAHADIDASLFCRIEGS